MWGIISTYEVPNFSDETFFLISDSVAWSSHTSLSCFPFPLMSGIDLIRVETAHVDGRRFSAVSWLCLICVQRLGMKNWWHSYSTHLYCSGYQIIPKIGQVKMVLMLCQPQVTGSCLLRSGFAGSKMMTNQTWDAKHQVLPVRFGRNTCDKSSTNGSARFVDWYVW